MNGTGDFGVTQNTRPEEVVKIAMEREKQARAFYLHLIPEFEQSPTDELHLVLLMKDILKTLAV